MRTKTPFRRHYIDYGENWRERGALVRYQVVDSATPMTFRGLRMAETVFYLDDNGEVHYTKNRNHGQSRPQSPEELEKLAWQILSS